MSVQAPTRHSTIDTAERDAITHSFEQMARDRAMLISYLVKLTRCVDAGHLDLTQAVAQRFSELLIDYLSLGHFRLLRTRQAEDHQRSALSYFTEKALLFSDKYAGCAPIQLQAFRLELESLAFALEVRFEIEDELLYCKAA